MNLSILDLEFSLTLIIIDYKYYHFNYLIIIFDCLDIDFLYKII